MALVWISCIALSIAVAVHTFRDITRREANRQATLDSIGRGRREEENNSQ